MVIERTFKQLTGTISANPSYPQPGTGQTYFSFSSTAINNHVGGALTPLINSFTSTLHILLVQFPTTFTAAAGTIGLFWGTSTAVAANPIVVTSIGNVGQSQPIVTSNMGLRANSGTVFLGAESLSGTIANGGINIYGWNEL